MKKVLLVDDDRDYAHLLEKMFQSQGYQTLLAHDSHQFREKAFTGKPQAIVLDINLGKEEGPAVYDSLLEDGFDRQIPVLFLSNMATEAEISPARNGRSFALQSKQMPIRNVVREVDLLLGGQARD